MRKLGGLVCDQCRTFAAYGTQKASGWYATIRQGKKRMLIYCSIKCRDKGSRKEEKLQ